MKIYIGSDHRGFELKEILKLWLQSQENEVIDCGNDHYDATDDYPKYSFTVGEHVSANEGSRGIVICGSSIGVTIAANKVKGIRAAAAISEAEVIHGREHDDINVLALAANYKTEKQAKQLITAFLKTDFKSHEERHGRRINLITEYEESH